MKYFNNNVKSYLSNQFIPFSLSIIVFLIAATLGWIKLKYGFNFVDEGFQMTESWRLAAGDHLLKDRTISVLRLYTLFNSQLFKLYPDITLLDFRRLQYILTLISLFLFSLVLYRVDKQFWFQPLIFSLFAFTGLDPLGTNSNLNYYTYPHFFLTLHISFFLLGLMHEGVLARRISFILSGFFLWGISLTMLHLSVIGIYPILLFFILKILNMKTYRFTTKDIGYVYAPFILCWLIFISFYNNLFFSSLIRAVELYTSLPTYASSALISINWSAMKYICLTFILLASYLFCFSKFRKVFTLLSFIIISLATYAIIDTSFFGFLNPYWNDWYSRPLWFSSIIILTYVIFFVYVIKNYFSNNDFNKYEELSLIILLPCSILYLAMSIFSGHGVLTAAHCSIPTIGALTLLILNNQRMLKRAFLIKFLLLFLLFFPFYYQTAWSDWRFTYFDVPPDKMNTTIQDGFCKDIKTNEIFSQLYQIISHDAEMFSEKDDFIISAFLASTVHMIAKRRPALDDPFICPSTGVLMDYYEQCIADMKRLNRYPVLAFLFENSPAFWTNSLKNENYLVFPPMFLYPNNDPVTRYVLDNMDLYRTVSIGNGTNMRCFIDVKRVPINKIDNTLMIIEHTLKASPEDFASRIILAKLYQQKGDKVNLENAQKCLEKSIDLQPTNYNALYNLACVLAKLGDKERSLDILQKSINFGFHDCNKLLIDNDLYNIKELPRYQKIVSSCQQ